MNNNMHTDLVSIVMPAYRAASLIEESISSVVAQTFPNWELLVVDDCSPDNTVQVVASAAARDPRIRLLRHERNQGPAAARNYALRHARGRWIAFLDSDDLWLPTKLVDTLAFAKSNQSALTYTGFRRISPDGERVGHYCSVPKTMNYRDLLGNTSIATSTVIVDRAIVGDFKMKDVYYDDFACWLEILRCGHVARGLEKDLMRYRVVKNSVSRNKIKSAREVWRAYREVENLSIFTSTYSFFNYTTNAIFKYRRF